jgi:DNA-binding IscR family transcriptional regulator
MLKPILHRLVKAGLVAVRGRKGYVLAKARGGNFDACPSRAACVLAVLCRKADESFRQMIREFTLENLREVSPDLPNGMDPSIEPGKRPLRSSKPKRRQR